MGGNGQIPDVVPRLLEAFQPELRGHLNASLASLQEPLAPYALYAFRSKAAVFGHNVKHVWGLVQGSFGFNLDVIVETTDGSLQHYYRNGDGWNEGVLINA